MSAPVRGKLVACPLPWSISPSGSFLKVVLEEEAADTIVEAMANRLHATEDELEPAPVRLFFRHGFRLITRGYGDSGHWEPHPFFDTSLVDALQQTVMKEGRIERWRRLGTCEWTRVFEVRDSLWEGEPIQAPWRHFVLTGSELWIEIVARSCRWIWDEHHGQPSREGGEISPLSVGA